MQKKEFRDFQLLQLSLLNEFARLCDQNNLTYYLIGGTLLGAVRHKGFIPWDPDIDVAMMRKDYDKFIEIAEKQLDKNRYFLATFQNEKDHYSPHMLLHSNCVEIFNPILTKYRSHKGIYLDIFPLDDAPDSKSEQNKQAKRIKFLKKIMYYKKAVIYERPPRIIKSSLKILLSLFLAPISLMCLQKRLEKSMIKYDCNGESKLVGQMASHYDYKRVLFKRDVYGTPKKVVFEGKTYSAPNKIDLYLKQCYGNYQELPSIGVQEYFYNAYKDISFVIRDCLK